MATKLPQGSVWGIPFCICTFRCTRCSFLSHDHVVLDNHLAMFHLHEDFAGACVALKVVGEEHEFLQIFNCPRRIWRRNVPETCPLKDRVCFTGRTCHKQTLPLLTWRIPALFSACAKLPRNPSQHQTGFSVHCNLLKSAQKGDRPQILKCLPCSFCCTAINVCICARLRVVAFVRVRVRVFWVFPLLAPPFCVSLTVSFESHRLKTLCHTLRKVSDPSTAMAHFATKHTPNTDDTFCRRKARHGTHRHIPRHSHRPRSFQSRSNRCDFRWHTSNHIVVLAFVFASPPCVCSVGSRT